MKDVEEIFILLIIFIILFILYILLNTRNYMFLSFSCLRDFFNINCSSISRPLTQDNLFITQEVLAVLKFTITTPNINT